MDNTDIIINGHEATWKMPLTHGELGGTYTGTFVFRCYLDPLSQLQAGRQYREYLGTHGMVATDTEINLAYALSQLSQRILKAPPFWTSTAQEGGIQGNIGDLNVIFLVLQAADKAEELFKEKIQKERDALLDRSIKVGEDLLRKKDE